MFFKDTHRIHEMHDHLRITTYEIESRVQTHTHTVIDSSAMPLAYILRFFLLLLVSLGSGKKDGRYAHDIMNK